MIALNIDTLNFLKSLFLFEPNQISQNSQNNYIFDFSNWLSDEEFSYVQKMLTNFRNKIVLG